MTEVADHPAVRLPAHRRFTCNDVWELPYAERRAILTESGLAQPGLQVPGNFTDTPGDLVIAAAVQQGLDGVVAKRRSSTYQPGRRSRNWITTPIRHTAEVIIAGWSPATGNKHVLGSLLLAAHDEHGELVYIGDVGTGFTDTARHALLAQLQDLTRDEPPFVGVFTRARSWPGRPPHRGAVHWVAPRLVGEVEYRNSPAPGTSATPRGGDYARTVTGRGAAPRLGPLAGIPLTTPELRRGLVSSRESLRPSGDAGGRGLSSRAATPPSQTCPQERPRSRCCGARSHRAHLLANITSKGSRSASTRIAAATSIAITTTNTPTTRRYCSRVGACARPATRSSPPSATRATSGPSCGIQSCLIRSGHGHRPGVPRTYCVLWCQPGTAPPVRQLRDGQLVPLAGVRHLRLPITAASGDGVEIDPVALMLTEQGLVRSDADMVFFGQPDHASGAVSLAADDTGAATALHVTPEDLPPDVIEVLLTSQLTSEVGSAGSAYMDVLDLDTGRPIGQLALPMPGLTGLLQLGALHRTATGWSLQAQPESLEMDLAALATAAGVNVG